MKSRLEIESENSNDCFKPKLVFKVLLLFICVFKKAKTSGDTKKDSEQNVSQKTKRGIQSKVCQSFQSHFYAEEKISRFYINASEVEVNDKSTFILSPQNNHISNLRKTLRLRSARQLKNLSRID